MIRSLDRHCSHARCSHVRCVFAGIRAASPTIRNLDMPKCQCQIPPMPNPKSWTGTTYCVRPTWEFCWQSGKSNNMQNKDRHCATTIAKLRRALRDCQDAKQGQALRHCATTIAKLGQALRKSMTVCGGIRDANVVMGLASVVGRARFCGVQQVLQFIPPL